MYSQLFCGTIETQALDFNQESDDEFYVKVYIVELSKYHELVSEAGDILSASERRRANRYHFEKDKNRFIICRILLKLLLANHIGVKVDELKLEFDTNKKPYLLSHPTVFFNISHSVDYAIIAIAKNPIGVDIEYINKKFNFNEILSTVFNKSEINEILNNKNKHTTFYKFWTRKEAVVKAVGKGIDDNLIKIPVIDELHSVPTTLLGNIEKICVFSFVINEDYIGALAITEEFRETEKIIFCSIPTLKELKSLIN